MKKLLFALTGLSLLMLTSCGNSEGLDPNKCYDGVRAKFPKAHIYHEPGSDILYWAVIDTDGTYYRVVTGNSDNGDVTRIVKQVELK